MADKVTSPVGMEIAVSEMRAGQRDAQVDVLLAVTKLGEHTGQCPLCGELLPHEDNSWGDESLGHASDCLALRAAAVLEAPMERGKERDEARRELCRALALAGPRVVAISPHEHAVGRWGQHVADKLFPQDEATQ